ncbi:TPA: hypothetical protein N0F65_008884 [Lagenidium giganteum]|uniref:U2A'/phosphoprotein 32 family A C-terminal domain-containing protein n=1 Tax=Lagenidium giganteum TaxID=4803 RepID=A0AAV2YWW6_9STRA|nr:TPA: hypothetical protein N0F65_008884 [Lagenidium giganteum]
MPLTELTRELVETIVSDYPLLQSINLSHNELQALDHLELLHDLGELDVSHNRLHALPRDLCHVVGRLKYLNASHNQLASLEPLAGCVNLQILEVSNNRIELISELRHLQALSALESLVLSENPIAQHDHYRREVVQMLPQLRTLDGSEITAAEKIAAKLQLPHNGAAGTVFTRPLSDTARTRLLTPQAVHEQQPVTHVLSAPHPSARSSVRRLSLSSFAGDPSDNGDDLLDERRVESAVVCRDQRNVSEAMVESGARRSPVTEVSNDTTLLQSRVLALESIIAIQDKAMQRDLESALETQRASDPAAVASAYMRQLTAWREHVIKLMVRNHDRDLESSDSKRRRDAEHDRLTARCAQLEAQVAIWKQKCTDACAQRDLHREELLRAQHKHQTHALKVSQAMKTLEGEKKKLVQVTTAISAFCAGGGIVQQKFDQLESGWMQMSVYGERIEQLTERVRVLHFLMSSQKAQLRNSEAAIEVERRLLQTQRQITEAEAMRSEKTGVPPKKLRHATELALRQLFHRLDPLETGLVRLSQFLIALRSDELILGAVKSDEKRRKLSEYLEKELGATSSAFLGGTITWGELMLAFVPGPDNSSTWSDDDAEAMLAQLDDNVPVISTPPKTAQKVEQHARKVLRSLSRDDLVREVLILRHDRQRLRHAIARHASQLHHRARLIQFQWSSKVDELLRKAEADKLLARKQSDKVQELQASLDVSLRDTCELQHQVKALTRELAIQKAAAQREISELIARHEHAMQRETDIWKKELDDVGFNYSTLQAENSKIKLTLRQLERELARAKEKAIAQESQQIASLDEKLRKRDDEIARLRRERNTVLSSLREYERIASIPKPRFEDAGTQTTQAATRSETQLQAHMGVQTDEVNTSPWQRSAESNNCQCGERQPMPEPTPAPVTADPVDARLRALESLTESLLAD